VQQLRGATADAGRVEARDVRDAAGRQQPACRNAVDGRRHRRQPSHGVLERQRAPLADPVAEEVRRITTDATYRIWRLYMAGSAHAFRSGRLNVYQTLLAKPLGGESGLPLTREDWYRI